jgi:hypothetical protein
MKRVFFIDKDVDFNTDSDENIKGFRNQTYMAMEFIEGFFDETKYLNGNKFKRSHKIIIEIK